MSVPRPTRPDPGITEKKGLSPPTHDGVRIETVDVCVVCLQPSSRSVCDGCESTGGLFGDWRSDSDG